MTLYNKALDTYRAIHGSEPQHLPYKGASDTPFNGLDVDVVSELCNKREVDSEVKEWKKQYPLKEPFLDTKHRFLKISKGGRYKDNAVWVPNVSAYIISYTKDEEWGYKEDTKASHISIIQIKDILNYISYTPLNDAIKHTSPDSAKPPKARIPNVGERDLFHLLTTPHHTISDIEDNLIPLWEGLKNKLNPHQKSSCFSVLVPLIVEHLISKSVYKVQSRNTPIWPIKVIHTSHGYPMIYALRCTGLSVEDSGDVKVNWGSENISSEKFKNTKLWLEQCIVFPGEVVKISDPVTLKDRLENLMWEKNNLSQ